MLLEFLLMEKTAFRITTFSKRGQTNGFPTHSLCRPIWRTSTWISLGRPEKYREVESANLSLGQVSKRDKETGQSTHVKFPGTPSLSLGHHHHPQECSLISKVCSRILGQKAFLLTWAESAK